MNGSGMRKSLRDVAATLMTTTKTTPKPTGFEDGLIGCKRKIMSFAKRALRSRAQDVDDRFDRFIRRHNGDWRVYPPVLYVDSGMSVMELATLKASFIEDVMHLLYSRSFSSPVPSAILSGWCSLLVMVCFLGVSQCLDLDCKSHCWTGRQLIRRVSW